jgi:chromosome segregation ATPase
MGSLIRHNSKVVVEPTEYGRVTVDTNDSNDAAYMDARSKDLLYFENTGSRYPEHGSIGWLPLHDIPKKQIPWISATRPSDTEQAGHNAHYATIPPRYCEADLAIATADYGLSGSLGDNAIAVRDMLLRLIFPQLRVGEAWSAAVERVLREQPTTCVYQFFHRVRREMNVLNTHTWKRDIMGVLECIAIPERNMTPLQQSISFRGPPEHIWTYLIDSDDKERGFSTPSVIMITNILRGMSRPDQDLTMVILTYLVQTGLGLEGQLRALYAHMVSMSEISRNQEVAIENLSRRFNEDLSNPGIATTTSLQSMITRLEAQTVALEKGKREAEERFERYKNTYPRKDPTEEISAISTIDVRARNKQLMRDLEKGRMSIIDSNCRNKKLEEDLNKVQEDLNLTQEELITARKDLAFHESALRTLLAKNKEREAEDAKMDDSDNDANPGVSRARREIESLKEQLRQSEQESHKLTGRLDDWIKESKRFESENNRLKVKTNKLEEKVKLSLEEINRNKSSHDKVLAQLDIAQTSENVKGNQITNLTERIKALQAQVAKHEKAVLEYQTGESEYQTEIMNLEDRLSESEILVKETKEQREALQLQYNELGQQLTSTQQELAGNKLLLTQNVETHRETERSMLEELERRKVEINEANMRVATAESNAEILRQQLANSQLRSSMPPPTSRQFSSWDSHPEPPTTPLVLPQVRDDNLHPANYYYRGSEADPGYTDPIRMPMYGTDLYSNTRGGSSSSSYLGDYNYNSSSTNQP